MTRRQIELIERMIRLYASHNGDDNAAEIDRIRRELLESLDED
jgi:hypothetical protein